MPDIDPNKTVFISYRRDVSKYLARAIFMDLREHGYDTFLDVETIDSGDWETFILNQIAARAHFLLILTPGTLDRCTDANDMVRREIEHAMLLGRNIVPILVEEFKFNVVQPYLVGKLHNLSQYNALRIPDDYFEEAMTRLRSRFLKQPMFNPVIQPLTIAEERQASDIIQQTASEPEPSQNELTSEQFFTRAYSKFANKDLDGAIVDYTEAIQLNPRYARAYINRGNIYQRKNDLDSALLDYDEALRLERNMVEAYTNRGVIKYRKGDIEDALIDFDTAIELNADYEVAYYNRGNVLARKGDLEAALLDFDKAIWLNSDYTDAYYNRANVRFRKGDYDGTIADCTKAIHLRPNDASAYNNRGRAYYQKDDLDAAIKDCTEAIRINPDYVGAYFNRGIAKASKGDIENAIMDYEKAIEIDTEYINAHINRAELYFILERFDEALTGFQMADFLIPDDEMIFAGLAITERAIGNINDARRLWMKLVERDERYEDAEWVGKELDWAEPLVEAARQLISELE